MVQTRLHANFHDRSSKARYVWERYKSILTGSVLDVGCDECYLRSYLASNTSYTGIGLGGKPDRVVDLEHEAIPFPERSFDCVVCLDVLEHLNNIHDVFDAICRVSRRYVLIFLPNPHRAWLAATCRAAFGRSREMKFYGLPASPPLDRHKWFFSASDAQRFLRARAELNGMRVAELEFELRHPLAKVIAGVGPWLRNCLAHGVWAVLERN